MNSTIRPFRSAVAAAVVSTLLLAGCGSDASDGEPSVTTEPVSDTPVTDTPVTDTNTGAVADTTSPEGDVIGTGNVGGPVVDPQPHPIDGIDVAESFPEQLIVRFTSGDPNCTAADATATADGEEVVVTLMVGITEDALARSCLAGDVAQSVTIALDEGLDGREVVAG